MAVGHSRSSPMCGDSGADRTTICKKFADEEGLAYEKNTKGTRAVTVATDQSVNIIGMMTKQVEIRMGTYGNITVRNVPIWVIEEDMNEILLGEDVLKRLGIDVHDQLKQRGGVEVDYYTTADDIATYPYLGGEDGKVLEKIIKQKVDEACNTEASRWKELLLKHIDQFRTTLSNDPPANVRPMNSQWDRGKANRVHPARISYTKEQKLFLDYYTKRLIDLGYAYVNPNARYVSECLVIPKKEKPTNYEDDYRLVVNLKKANAVCEPLYWPLSTLEDLQQHLDGARYYIVLDLKNGYWQVKLDERCQELFSFCTHNKVLTPTRIPQGSVDAVMYFTYVVTKIFEDRIQKGVLPWIDDLLLYAKDLDELYELLKWVLEQAKRSGFKFNPKKMVLLSQRIEWCGKIITPEGIHVNPKRIESLTNLQKPKTGADLMQFINAANWIRTSLPRYSEVMGPLQVWLNGILSDGKRTSKRAGKVVLKWSNAREESFEEAKSMILKAVTQAHPADEATICLFTDASDNYWGAGLFQIREYDRNKEAWNQPMEPLHFLSGKFKGSQQRWSTTDKEAFAIVEAVDRLKYLLIRPNGFRLYIDHRNLRFMFNASSSVKLNVRARRDRWSLKLQGYRFDIEHVPGELNVWADLLSRWGQRAYDKKPNHSVKKGKLQRLTYRGNVGKRKVTRHTASPVVLPMNKMEWPTKARIIECQANAENSPAIANNVEVDEDGIKRVDGVIWIPDENIKMQKIITIIAHYGASGHNGSDATRKKVETNYCWTNIKSTVDDIVMDCILCRIGKGERPTRIHLGEHPVPTGPNEQVHFDFYYVGESASGETYLLVIRDGFSRYTMLLPTDGASATTAAQGILHWISLFGLPRRFFSDNGSHFRNTVMLVLAKQLDIKHEFATAYCAWANGLIERVNRDVKSLIKIVLLEGNIAFDEWTRIISNLMFAINQRSSKVLNGHAPITVHTGIRASDVLQLIVEPKGKKVQNIEWSERMFTHLDVLGKTLDKIHDEVQDATKRVNQYARKHKKNLPQYEIGDYILWCRVDQNGNGKKHDFMWTGPYQVVDTKTDHIYEIKDIVSSKIVEAHVTRMSFYSDDRLQTTGELKDLISRQGIIYEVEEIIKVEKSANGYKVLIRWRGFTSNEETWERFQDIVTQIPLMMANFLLKWKQDEPEKFKEFWNDKGHKYKELEEAYAKFGMEGP